MPNKTWYRSFHNLGRFSNVASFCIVSEGKGATRSGCSVHLEHVLRKPEIGNVNPGLLTICSNSAKCFQILGPQWFLLFFFSLLAIFFPNLVNLHRFIPILFLSFSFHKWPNFGAPLVHILSRPDLRGLSPLSVSPLAQVWPPPLFYLRLVSWP